MDEDQELRVIHTLRLKGFADTPAVAEAAELRVDETATVLEQLAAAGHVRYREGRLTGWMLLPEGRVRGEALLAAGLSDPADRAAVESGYERFLARNQDFLALCTDWQVRTVDGEQVVNDHGDAAYDAVVIARLHGIDADVQPLCAELSARFPRFGSYGPRFAEALGKVDAGELDWFTKPVIDSYHTVWFELHEDLLATLGIERGKEVHP